MESFEAKREKNKKLHQRFKKLEQEWHTLKESKSSTGSHKYPSHSNETIHKPRKYSPRELMLNLQQESPSPADAWKNLMTNDMASQEILQERREAIETGKLKGRRLFQCENVTMRTPQREVRSMSFYDSVDDESSEIKGVHDYCTRGLSSSSSSSSCFAGGCDDMDQDVDVVAHLVATTLGTRVASTGCGRPDKYKRIRYAAFLGGFAIIFLVIAMCLSLTRSSREHDCNVIMVPT